MPAGKMRSGWRKGAVSDENAPKRQYICREREMTANGRGSGALRGLGKHVVEQHDEGRLDVVGHGGGGLFRIRGS